MKLLPPNRYSLSRVSAPLPSRRRRPTRFEEFCLALTVTLPLTLLLVMLL